MNPINPYLFGDMYSIHPIHFGKVSRFLKKPENKIIGRMRIGTTADTDLASKITLPKSNPNEAPLKDMRKNTRQ